MTDEPLAAAQGCILGALLGAGVFAALFFAVWVLRG